MSAAHDNRAKVKLSSTLVCPHCGAWSVDGRPVTYTHIAKCRKQKHTYPG